MKTTAKLFLVLAAVALSAACSLATPEYAGSWVDEETLFGWTITLEFARRDFSIAMETYDVAVDMTVGNVTSGVMSADAGVMRATITGQEVDGDELGDPELHAFLAYIGGGEYTASYKISGNTMTLSGELVEKLLSVPSVAAARQ